MKRVMALAACLACVAGCGSTSSSGTAGASSNATTTQQDTSYHNMDVLSQSVQQTFNTKYRKPGQSEVTNASCISTGGQSAECNLSFADGSSNSIGVTISADGASWISHS